MLNKLKNAKQQKSDQGFTIIEVMIVLAIAGLILLIVFLAVPALQRNARNTQRKNDAAQISAAVSNFISNNGGALPTAVGLLTTDSSSEAIFCNGAAPTNVTLKQSVAFAGSTCTNTNNNSETAKLGYYIPSDNHIYITNTTGSSITAGALGTESATSVTTQSITIDVGYGCNNTNTGADTVANSRKAAVLYATETGGSNVGSLQCIEP